MTMMTTKCRTRRGGEEEPKEKEQNSVNKLCQILNAMLKHIFFNKLLICSRVFYYLLFYVLLLFYCIF